MFGTCEDIFLTGPPPTPYTVDGAIMYPDISPLLSAWKILWIWLFSSRPRNDGSDLLEIYQSMWLRLLNGTNITFIIILFDSAQLAGDE